LLDAQGRLSHGSPAIDLAASTPGVSVDRDGSPRSLPFDAGADEF